MAGYWKLVLVLDDHTATAHHPTVPPRGERAVIIVVVAVTLFDHLLKHLCAAREHRQRITTPRSGRQAR